MIDEEEEGWLRTDLPPGCATSSQRLVATDTKRDQLCRSSLPPLVAREHQSGSEPEESERAVD
jgi:hypothetical protein